MWETHISYLNEVAENERAKLLLAAKKIRKPTTTEFVISFIADDSSRASSTYLGKLRSNFLGTKFAICDSQPPQKASIQANNHSSSKFHSKQVSPRVPAHKYNVASITLNSKERSKKNGLHFELYTYVGYSGSKQFPNSNNSSAIFFLTSSERKSFNYRFKLCKLARSTGIEAGLS